MPTSDEQAFHAAIAAAPDDDTPRLAFADWLDERGGDDDRVRADLIRVQCRAETLKPTSKERRELDKRAKAILKEHARRWTKPLHDIFLGTWEYRRGFIDHVTVGARRFARNAKHLPALAPTLTSAYFPNASNEVNDLLRSSHLKRLRRVDLHSMCSCGGCAIQDELITLFHSKKAANVRELNVSGNRLAPHHVHEMLSSLKLTKLTRLDLSNNPLGPAGITALVSTPALDSLESLDLSGTRPTKSGVETLAAWKHPNLKRLALRRNEIGAAVRLLMKSPLINQLRELDLSHNLLGESGAAVVTEQAGFDAIEVLDLRHNDIGSTFAIRKRFGKRVRV